MSDKKKIKKGGKLSVTVKLETEGTIRNHSIFVESQHIPTINQERKDFDLEFDGDPVKLDVTILGVASSKIKKMTVKINDVSVIVYEDVKLKYELTELSTLIPYRLFNLEEAK
jgi:hypothetical protein